MLANIKSYSRSSNQSSEFCQISEEKYPQTHAKAPTSRMYYPACTPFAPEAGLGFCHHYPQLPLPSWNLRRWGQRLGKHCLRQPLIALRKESKTANCKPWFSPSLVLIHMQRTSTFIVLLTPEITLPLSPRQKITFILEHGIEPKKVGSLCSF